MIKFHNALLVLACGLAIGISVSALGPSAAHAEDGAVVQRLTGSGGLSAAAAKRLIAKVSQRMAKSADTLASANDPLRVALSNTLFHVPVPPDTMSAAKMRLKLYAGLNEAALEALFAPKGGAIASCVRATAATQPECEALVAAAGRVSVAEAKSSSGGPGLAVAVVAPTRAQPAAAPAAGGGSHFGRYDSGFAKPAPAPAYVAAAPVQRAQPATFQPVQRAQPAAFHSAPARGAQPAVSAKEAYRLQREAYLARQKEQFEERKQKLAAAGAPAESSPAPATAAPTAPVAAKPTAVAAKGVSAPAKAAPVAAVDEAPAEAPAAAAAPAAKSDKPTLDGDFLDGLLADPLGGKK